MLRSNTKRKPKRFLTLLRAPLRWVGMILVSLFTTIEQSPRATSNTWSRQRHATQRKVLYPVGTSFRMRFGTFRVFNHILLLGYASWNGILQIDLLRPQQSWKFWRCSKLVKSCRPTVKEWLFGQETYALHQSCKWASRARTRPEPGIYFWSPIQPASQIYWVSQDMRNCGISKNVVCGCRCRYTILSHPK